MFIFIGYWQNSAARPPEVFNFDQFSAAPRYDNSIIHAMWGDELRIGLRKPANPQPR